MLSIPQAPSTTGTSPSDCLVFYPGHSLGKEVLPICRGAVSVFYSLSRWAIRCRKKWYLPSSSSVIIITRVGGKFQGLIKIPWQKVTKWGLFFNIVLLVVDALLLSVLQSLDPIYQKIHFDRRNFHWWRSMWSKVGAILKNKPHLVVSSETIKVSFWIFQLTFVKVLLITGSTTTITPNGKDRHKCQTDKKTVFKIVFRKNCQLIQCKNRRNYANNNYFNVSINNKGETKNGDC